VINEKTQKENDEKERKNIDKKDQINREEIKN
jgi:hypothetical protein